MTYNNRQLSPGGRRIQNPGRTSDNITDQYNRYDQRHNSYVSPRSSNTGVVPISTQTYVNIPSSGTQGSRSDQQRYETYSGRPTESYSGRPRRTSHADQTRGSVSSGSTQVTRGSRPTVVQNESARPSSPQKGLRDKDYYVSAASSKEPRKVEHKKVYSVNDGTASLVSDVNLHPGHDRHHKRRESYTGERGRDRGASIDQERGRRDYHLNGPSKPKEKSIEDDDAYSYTDPAAMYRETEPRQREREVRPRRGSVDRGGASRERPVSMLDPGADARKGSKDIGPPPSMRGWDRLNDGLGRSRSTRERSRDRPRSPTRARVPQSPTRAMQPQSPTRGRGPDDSSYGDSRDAYYVPPRTNSIDDRSRYLSVYPDRQSERTDPYEYDDRVEPRRRERRSSMTRVPDHSVERRGFGIRRDESQDRYGRVSDESVTQPAKYRDSGYAVPEPPHRRGTAPDLSYHDEQRLEQEKRDRMIATERKQEAERQAELEARDREYRRSREDDKAYDRDYERDRDREPRRDRGREYDVDREREQERERMMQPQPQAPPQSDHDRHHYRQESNRDREYLRNEPAPRDSGEIPSQPRASTAAAAGLTGAAAAYGVGSALNKHDDRDKDRERERERERDRDQDRRYERARDYEDDRPSPRSQDLRPPDTRTRDAHSDEGVPYQQDRDRHRPAEQDRGLGFAFEQPPEPPMSAPPMHDRQEPPPPRERADERDFERSHEDEPQAAFDPDEDYRRRMAQAQQELGRGTDDRGFDQDPDRERRRRDREQRARDRLDNRNGDGSTVGGSSTFTPSMVTNSTFTDTTAPSQVRSSFENESVQGTDSTFSRPGLHRKPSILDQPMTDDPAQYAQVIDNSMSERRENRVRIVDPPTEEEERKPKGILKKPKEKFPDYPNQVREGVAPLKDATKSGIPPGARWTKIDRRLVNPEALEAANERFEERLDCVIVLRVLTKEEIQKLADKTRKIRDERYEEERDERKAARRRDREHDRKGRDEYEDNSEDEFKPKAPKMLEAPSTAGASSDQADFVREQRDRRRDREGEREQQYMSGGLGRRDG